MKREPLSVGDLLIGFILIICVVMALGATLEVIGR